MDSCRVYQWEKIPHAKGVAVVVESQSYRFNISRSTQSNETFWGVNEPQENTSLARAIGPIGEGGKIAGLGIENKWIQLPSEWGQVADTVWSGMDIMTKGVRRPPPPPKGGLGITWSARCQPAAFHIMGTPMVYPHGQWGYEYGGDVVWSAKRGENAENIITIVFIIMALMIISRRLVSAQWWQIQCGTQEPRPVINSSRVYPRSLMPSCVRPARPAKYPQYSGRIALLLPTLKILFSMLFFACIEITAPRTMCLALKIDG